MKSRMTPEKIDRVQSSWRQLRSFGSDTAALFYNKLFELDPDLKKLFHGSIEQQAEKLMSMIGTAVDGLDDVQQIEPMLTELGRRHVSYGVSPNDYRTMGAALLWTLELGLGKDFTANTKLAWLEFYNLLADTMKRAG